MTAPYPYDASYPPSVWTPPEPPEPEPGPTLTSMDPDEFPEGQVVGASLVNLVGTGLEGVGNNYVEAPGDDGINIVAFTTQSSTDTTAVLALNAGQWLLAGTYRLAVESAAGTTNSIPFTVAAA